MAKKIPGTSSTTNTGPRRAPAKKKVAAKKAAVPAKKAAVPKKAVVSKTAVKKTNKKGPR